MNHNTTQPIILERRQNADTALLQLIQQIHDNQIALDVKVSAHINEEPSKIAEAVAKLIKDAFPDGDLSLHKEEHKANIARAKAKAEFWNGIARGAATWGAVGLLGWLAMVVWQALKQGIKP